MVAFGMRTALIVWLAALLLACRVEGGKDTAAPVVNSGGDEDGDGFTPAENDCDDQDDAVFPRAVELCDGLDNNCDGTVDEDLATTWYADADGDGFGDEAASIAACEPPSTGYSADGSDCDDHDSTIHPAAEEVCNEIDDDCDGEIDEDLSEIWYPDADGDAFGDEAAGVPFCGDPGLGWVLDFTDCDDSEAAAFPGGTEVCDELDNDCDGGVDEDVDTEFWADIDGDGYGSDAAPLRACSVPTGYTTIADDCDDADSSINPAAVELCDGLDNDCDGTIDEPDAADASMWYADNDSDGYGDPATAVTACDVPLGYLADASDCDDSDATIYPGAPAHCGLDADCDGTIDDVDPGAIRAGSLVAGDSQHLQYSAVTSGAGWLDANWDGSADADSYELIVGTSAGADDVLTWTDHGAVIEATLSGLSLGGAWTGAEYFVSVRAVTGGDACPTVQISDRVRIAEAVLWTGNAADLRANDAWGGSTLDWPEVGSDVVYGEHWFEEVEIPAGSIVRVQGWGAANAVREGVSATDATVTDPLDGWLAIYANDVTVSGTIVATGAGYGGGGGGGGSGTVSYRGHGGELGLGGDGGVSFAAYAGAGGGGSPGGLGGVGATIGGDGNVYGGGSGSTGCGGSDGRDGGDGSVSTFGGTGGTASSGVAGAAGLGEFSAGGGSGVSGCDNWSGGGGGGYGGGGGGGGQWAGPGEDSSGGGGGGTGGVGGGDTGAGGSGAGPWGGAGGSTSVRTGIAGTVGGYLAAAGNGDGSTDRSLALGSGGGGGGGGYQESGGGGGAAGGGALHIYAFDSLWVGSSGRLLVNGAGGGGGARDDGGSSTSAGGGGGGGGGLRLEGRELTVDATCPAISVRGGNGDATAGGTIKLFYDTLLGTTPSASCAGRVYDAGSGSWASP